MNILTEHVLVAGAALFALGLLGFLTRRSLILVFISLELMLAAVSVNFVAFSRLHQNYQGQIMAIFVLTVAACEAALALTLIVSLYRRIRSLDFQVWNALGETSHPYDGATPGQLGFVPTPMDFPRLTTAGLDPMDFPSPVTPPEITNSIRADDTLETERASND